MSKARAKESKTIIVVRSQYTSSETFFFSGSVIKVCIGII
jgi:hypothetical protein